MNCFILFSVAIYTIAIYFTLVLIFIFGIKPYLYKNKKRTIRFLLPMWAYVLLFVIGTIPVLNLIVLVGLIIITIMDAIDGELYIRNNDEFFNFLNRKL